jgi:KRAB domain-containing zinc finger protein
MNFPFQIQPNDSFPDKICSSCENEIIYASSIKQKVLDSDEILRAQIKNEVQVDYQNEPIRDLKRIALLEVEALDAYAEESLNPESVKLRKRYQSTLNYIRPSLNHFHFSKSPREKERKNKVPNELDYKCFLCDSVFDKISSKNSHVKTDHKDERNCKICQAKCKTSLSLETHVKFHEVDYNFMCEVCSKVFRYRNRLISHMTLHHEKATEMVCDLCGLATKFKNNIKRHIKSVHMKLREFQCDQCSGHPYSTQEALNSHLYRYHNVPAPIKCPDCLHGFTFDSELRAHKKHGFCSNTAYALFVRRGKPQYEHLEVVDQTGEHICKLCNEAFPSKSKFSMHNYLKHKHSNTCDECKISFTNYTSLIRHQKVKHEGLKPFKCEFCSKAFGQKVSLISHRVREKKLSLRLLIDDSSFQNTHTGEKTFSCAYCPFKSGDHGTVSKHKKKAHPEMTVFSSKTST